MFVMQYKASAYLSFYVTNAFLKSSGAYAFMGARFLFHGCDYGMQPMSFQHRTFFHKHSLAFS